MWYYVRQFFDYLTMPIRAFFSAPGRVFASGKRVFGLSLPARVALFVAFFLIVCVAVSFIIFARTQGRPFLAAKMRYMAVIVVLVVVIPFVVYKLLKVWLEGEVSPFADIEHAWNAGLAELKRHGLDITQIPLFLILGSEDEAQEKALFDASRLSFNIREVPLGPAALHWYANPDGIYVACTRVGSLSLVAAWDKKRREEQKGRSQAAAYPPEADPLRGTIVAGGGMTSEREAAPARFGRDLPEASPPPDLRSVTIDFSKPPAMAESSGAPGPRLAVTLEDAVEQQRRLEYLCQLVRRARQPICPYNGLLTLLPFGLLQRGARDAALVEQAAARDLATLHHALQLRVPVVALVAGMEEESGFRELVRRVGRDRAINQRFGKGFELTNPPIPERLVALASHACGAFEDSIYALFKERNALAKQPGNTKLYSLLARIRHQLHEPLANLLENVYGADLDKDPHAEPFFFSGCYFAGVGMTEDCQAFVKAVFDKLVQDQGELQWTSAARRRDRLYQGIAQFLYAVDFVLLALLIALVGYRFFLS